tara:strand:- start:296 stop:523 length:228 start_codon:yes stop_codon:yes gene_type:complete
MAVKKANAAEECCQKCESDISALKKELASLKRQLGKAKSGGSDPRVDKLIEILQDHQGNWLANKYLESLGIKFNN